MGFGKFMEDDEICKIYEIYEIFSLGVLWTSETKSESS